MPKALKIAALLSVVALVPILTATKPDKDTNTGGLAGVQEFFTSGTFTAFTAPSGVTHVMLTIWGGGGGAGAQRIPECMPCGMPGGGGGGAYTKTVLPVNAGVRYTVTVGAGGIGGINFGENGGNGGDSQFALGHTNLAFAGGGQGGQAGMNGDGVGGSGGQADPNAQISHTGNAAVGYRFGPAYAANLAPIPAMPLGPSNLSQTGGFPVQGGIGNGGDAYGASWSVPNGAPGYVLLTF